MSWFIVQFSISDSHTRTLLTSSYLQVEIYFCPLKIIFLILFFKDPLLFLVDPLLTIDFRSVTFAC